MSLRGRVALVTGSTRGIGKAIALYMAREGASVIMNSSRSPEEAKDVLRQLPGSGHCFIKADVRSRKAIMRMMAQIRKRYNRIDILVNNAGTTRFIEHGDLKKLTADIFDEIYQVHVRGSFLCTQAALDLLRKSSDPSIINIASIAATTAMGSNIAYCAMKAAVVNMTKSMARALAPDIRVNSISPGLTATGLIKRWHGYTSEQLKRTPLGRLARPEDVADAAVALAASLKYVTGQDIIVDGGRSLER